MGIIWNINRNIPEAQKQQYMKIAADMGVRFGVPYNVIVGVIAQESAFDPSAYRWSEENPRDRSFGLMQLVLPTAQAMLDKLYGVGKKIATKDYLYNAKNNIELGTAYLKEQFDRFGTWENAVSAYNAGRPISGNYANYVLKVLQKGASMPIMRGGFMLGSVLVGGLIAWYVYKRIRS